MNYFGFVLLFTALAVGTNASKKEKLVGAKKAEIGAYPYQASLRLKGQHFCGGALITKRHILTAAHCIYPIKKNGLLKTFVTVVLGTNSLSSGGKAYKVKDFSYCDDYYDQSLYPEFKYDIGVITLVEEVTLSKMIQIIPLPTKELKDGDMAVITGWGTMRSPASPVSPVLRELKVKIVSNAMCQRYYDLDGEELEIVAAHVCVYKGHGYGTCSGDSGGPLVSGGQIIGVVSGGVACAQGFPDVFTRVSSYLDYIKEIIGHQE